MKNLNLQTILLASLVIGAVAKVGSETLLLNAYGDKFRVTYIDASGERRVWTTDSVHSDPVGTGYVFVDDVTTKTIRVSGSVLVEQID